MTDIRGFFGDYRWMSNFWLSGFYIGSTWYDSNEHYFQSSKAMCEQDHTWVREAPTPGLAKYRGKRIPLRQDWEKVKVRVMLEGLRNKFDQNPDLKQKLIDTGNAYLEETNSWGDTFWGVSQGKGCNQLGVLLMELRREYQMGEILGD
jgi:ribA/ribD-fused uncharacterized protein